ncbi:MAG: homoserine dehydrogenase [Bacillota bacterium]|nr:homoserine dehydrogenase [Bacillota bacterium]
MAETLNVALLGFGNVGSSVWQLTEERSRRLAWAAGRPIRIRRALVRDPAKPRAVTPPAGLLTADPEEVLDDPAVEAVVELMGGLDPAGTYVRRALASGRSVVTANKELIAEQGPELLRLAREHGAQLRFEASVGAGIPIIRPIEEMLVANRITRVTGILNGTTNYIASRMASAGATFRDALAEAQELGYAEPDPSDDVEGRDTARKLAILASYAFGSWVCPEAVYTEGITELDPVDLGYAAQLGYAVRLVGTAVHREAGIEARVHPALVPQDHPLASVRGAANAIFVEGDPVGELMFYGLGAGGYATASSILGDLVQVARGSRPWRPEPRSGEQALPVLPSESIESAYYLRLEVADSPGTLAAMAGAMARHRISLRQVLQMRAEEGRAEVVFVTHPAREAEMRQARRELEELPSVHRVASLLRFHDGAR